MQNIWVYLLVTGERRKADRQSCQSKEIRNVFEWNFDFWHFPKTHTHNLSIFIHFSYQLISLIYPRLHHLFSNFFACPSINSKANCPPYPPLS